MIYLESFLQIYQIVCANFRSNMKKSHLSYTPTLGTCPDMCPEKERLLREIQHQVIQFG